MQLGSAQLGSAVLGAVGTRSQPALTIAPSAIESTFAMGSPSLTGGARLIDVASGGIVSTFALGSPVIANANPPIQPASIPSTFVVGAPVVGQVLVTYPPGIASTFTLGTPTVRGGLQNVVPRGIASTFQLGAPRILGGAQGLQVWQNSTRLTNIRDIIIRRQMRGRSDASLKLWDSEGLQTIIPGAPIRVIENGELRFAGLINGYDRRRFISTSGQFDIDITCEDWQGILDRRVVVAKYPANSLVYNIVLDIWANKLQRDGFTTRGVLGDAIIDEDLILDHLTVTESFNRISDLTGQQWSVDYLKDITFRQVANITMAPISLTETSKNFHGGDYTLNRVRRDLRDYRNRQYVKSDLVITAGTRTETFTADGVLLGFITKFPITATPVVTENGVPQTVWELGVDVPETGYYWIRGGYGVFVWPQVAPANGTVITVAYQGFSSSSVVVDDPAEIASRAAVESGSGEWENVYEIAGLQTVDQATELAEGLLRRSKTVPVEFEFETEVPGIQPGQLVAVNLPAEGLSGNYLITEVQSQSTGADDLGYGSQFTHSVTATSGEDLGNWMRWYERLVERTRKGPSAARYAKAQWVLGVGTNITGGNSLTNPYRVEDPGELVEAWAIAGTAPINQTLELNIIRNRGGVLESIFRANGRLRIVSNSTAIVTVSSFALNPYLIAKDDVLLIDALYLTGSGSLTPARDVTAGLKWRLTST